VSGEIALALSGGGVRAMAFHMGVLRFLAENNALERISDISTVSGGSLLTGLIFSKNGLQWPNSEEFLGKTHPQIKKSIVEH